MSNTRAALAKRIDLELTQSNIYIILLNVTGTISATSSDAEILQYECIQSAGGYAPQPLSYTAGSSTFDTGSNYQKYDATVAFTEAVSGAGYSFTHAARIQGRGANANKQVSSIDTSTDRLTVLNHGLTNGDFVFVTSTGTLPGGLSIQKYYAKTIDADNLELYTDSALTAKVDITSAGTGSAYLRYANGTVMFFDSITGTINPGDEKSIISRTRTQ
jgi:hypothetical protein